jgi:glucose-6-phosphate-specific signal transduction histidine kinase
VPACYYAYRQNLGLIIGFMAMLFCSLFWFTAPVDVPPHVSGYLEWEKQLFFSDKSLVPGLVLVIVVAAFLVGLFSTFWHRNPWLGLLLINAGTAMKIVVSVVLGKESGYAAIVPSLTSLLIINVIGFVVWRFFKDRLDPENRP